jgi:hypothetical protein
MTVSFDGSDSSIRTCGKHPDRAAIALCAECDQFICFDCVRRGDDGLSRCSECTDNPFAVDLDVGGSTDDGLTSVEGPSTVRPSPVGLADVNEAEPASQLGALIPWEDPTSHSDVWAFGRTVGLALMRPLIFMKHVPWQATQIGSPLIFALMVGLIGQLAQTARIMMEPQLLTNHLAGVPGLPNISPSTLLLITLPFLGFLLFLESWVAHTLLRLAGAARASYSATFRVFAYAQASAVLLWLPLIGPYAYKFYVIFLILNGLRASHGAGLGASLLAIMPALLLQSFQ